jgi:hypothetical protein
MSNSTSPVAASSAEATFVSVRCDTCGNIYDKGFSVQLRNGQTFTFDSFECAITKLAPVCTCCGCRVIGHGVEASDRFFCCAHCARKEGELGLYDRKDAAGS